MTTETARQAGKRAPKTLSKPGRLFWKRVVSTYELRVDELLLLETACRTIDLLHDMDLAMQGQPLTTKGSMGQEREHPLLSEARQQRAFLTRALAQLKLPDPVSGAQPNQQRAAAQSRWASRGGA